MFDIPVAIIFFNRPDKLRETFEKVKQVQPSKLFLIQDGARNDRFENDTVKIHECREIVSNIDWNCEVYREYSEKNLGCGIRPSSGISFAFSKVDKLIILEDDCVVDVSYFNFCKQMLEKYELNQKIMLISGMNLLDQWRQDECSYFFSQVCTIGAWATWKRVWDNYDFEIKSFDNKDNKKILNQNIKFTDVRNQKFWAWNLTREKIKHNEKIVWWDYQFHYWLYLNNGLGVIPSKNLVLNIGFGEDATNVADKEAGAHFNLQVYQMEKDLREPAKIECDEVFDRKVYDLQHIKVNKLKILLSKIKRMILRIGK